MMNHAKRAFRPAKPTPAAKPSPEELSRLFDESADARSAWAAAAADAKSAEAEGGSGKAAALDLREWAHVVDGLHEESVRKEMALRRSVLRSGDGKSKARYEEAYGPLPAEDRRSDAEKVAAWLAENEPVRLPPSNLVQKERALAAAGAVQSVRQDAASEDAALEMDSAESESVKA